MRGVAASGLVALCVVVPVWGLGRAISLVAPALLVVAVTATVMALTPRPVDDGRAVPARQAPVSASDEFRWWCLVAASCASVVLCLKVAASVAPPLLLLCVAALVVTSPPVRALAVRFTSPGGAGPRSARDDSWAEFLLASGDPTRADNVDVRHDTGPMDARIADLNVSELCHLWRVTFWMVKDVRSAVRTLQVVDLRQAILDELEQRRPDAVARWLTSGHHQADGPARYL